MYNAYARAQFTAYNNARDIFIREPKLLIDLEKFISDQLYTLVLNNITQIKSDYNEASFLYHFWKNYPPEDRGRQPIMDQYPWIEVGEHAIGCKLPRILDRHFTIRDVGLPTGADQRFILSHDEISTLTNGLTNSCWLFVDVKSIGPRDDQDHTVMSHNQVSGDGTWVNEPDGMTNRILVATGSKASHDFHCSMPPVVVLSDGTIAPLIIIALKPVYRMLPRRLTAHRNGGQPLERIDIATLPNGLLLTVDPNYLGRYPGLLFPGKDDKSKDPRKLRARVSFEILRKINAWRYRSIPVTYP